MKYPIRYKSEQRFPEDVKGSKGAVYISSPNVSYSHSTFSVSSDTFDDIAVPENKDRDYLLLVNDSDNVIYIREHTYAAIGAGIRLNPNGGSFEMSRTQGNLSTRAIYAVSKGSDDNLLITEGEIILSL